MKVALIGGTGFVGSYLTDELVAQGHEPAILVRAGSHHQVRHAGQVKTVQGDISDAESIRTVMRGCDAAIYNIGILRESLRKGITFEALQYEGAVRCIDIASASGVGRFLLTSAYGVKPHGTTYQATKFRADEYLRASGLRWTIFRPTTLFGDPRGHMEFCTQLRNQLIKPPLPAPLFYDGIIPVRAGSFGMAPVCVRDVARVYIKALSVPESEQTVIDLCGPAIHTWANIIKTIARACQTRKRAVPVPAAAVKSMAGILGRFEAFPITRDQLMMLMEGASCDSSAVFKRFGQTPTDFNESGLSYLSPLK